MKVITQKDMQCGEPRRGNERKRKDRHLIGFCQKAEKALKHNGDVIAIVVGFTGKVSEETGGSGEERKNGNHPEHC